MECAELAERLTDFLEGALSDEVEAAAVEHLATCSACEAVLADTRHVMAVTHDHGRVELSAQARGDLWGRIVGEVGPNPGD